MKTGSPLDARLQHDKDCLFDCAETIAHVYPGLEFFQSISTSCLTRLLFFESSIFGPRRLGALLVVRSGWI